jgi:hypothetical protein
MRVIERGANTAHNDGRIAVLTKAHHGAADGILAANLLARLWQQRIRRAAARRGRRLGQPNQLQIAANGLVHLPPAHCGSPACSRRPPRRS